MRSRVDRVVLAAVVALLPLAAPAQSPFIDTACIEPFVTSSGYVLTPQCPRQALTALVDPEEFDMLPALDPFPQRRQAFRYEERRIPGTEVYVGQTGLRNQFVYNPGQQLPLGTREAALDFVFGVRVPF